MSRTPLVALALLVGISLGCGSSVELNRLKAVAAKEHKAAEAAGADAERVRRQAAEEIFNAESKLAEARRLREEAADLKSSVRAASSQAVEALAAAQAERRLATSAEHAALLARREAANTQKDAERKLDEAKRLRDEADAMEANAVETLAAARNDRRLAGEELSAAEEARASAARYLDEVRQERRDLNARFVELDRRREQLDRDLARAQAIIKQSALAAAKAEEAYHQVTQQRAQLRDQQRGLAASLHALKHEMAEAETAIASVQSAELVRLIAAAKQMALGAAADFTDQLRLVADRTKRYALALLVQSPAEEEPAARPLVTEGGQGGRTERLR
jgi:chromosome segregation ATPase